MMPSRPTLLLLACLLGLAPLRAGEEATENKKAPASPAATAATDDRIGRVLEVGRKALVQLDYTVVSGTNRYTGRQLALWIHEDGLLVTSGAIRQGGTRIEAASLRFPGEDAFHTAHYLGKDEDANLAFFQADASAFPDYAAPLNYADRPALPAGTSVALVSLIYSADAPAPFVQAGRIMTTVPGPQPRYLTDMPVYVHSPCAPLLTLDGEPAGLIVAQSGAVLDGSAGMRTFLAYPAALVARLAAKPPEEARERERQHGWLGIVMGTVSRELARHWDLGSVGGVVVSQVLADSPADKAGFRRGDIITRFDGNDVDINHGSQLQRFIRVVKETPTGKSVPVQILRNRSLEAAGAAAEALSPPVFEPMELEVTLGVRPPSALYEEYWRDPLVGIMLKDVTVEDRVRLHLDPSVEGVLVVRVEDGSWAHLADIQPGDVIARMDGKAVADLERYRALLRAVLQRDPQAVLLFLHRDGGTVFRVLRPRRETAP